MRVVCQWFISAAGEVYLCNRCNFNIMAFGQENLHIKLTSSFLCQDLWKIKIKIAQLLYNCTFMYIHQGIFCHSSLWKSQILPLLSCSNFSQMGNQLQCWVILSS